MIRIAAITPAYHCVARLSGGMYLCWIEAGEVIITRKISLVK